MQCRAETMIWQDKVGQKIFITSNQRLGFTKKRASGSHFVSYGTIECIVAYGETSETRWRRPWFCTLYAPSLVHPGLYLNSCLRLRTKSRSAIVNKCPIKKQNKKTFTFESLNLFWNGLLQCSQPDLVTDFESTSTLISFENYEK